MSLAVIAHHLWPTRLPGDFLGVDVFFVISGSLITTLLLREHAQAGRVDLGGAVTSTPAPLTEAGGVSAPAARRAGPGSSCRPGSRR